MKTQRASYLSLIVPGAAAWFLGFLALGGGVPGVRIAQANDRNASMYCQSGYGTPCPSTPCPEGSYYCDEPATPAQCQGPAQTDCEVTSAAFGSCGDSRSCSTGQLILINGQPVTCPELPSACTTIQP